MCDGEGVRQGGGHGQAVVGAESGKEEGSVWRQIRTVCVLEDLQRQS